MFGPSWSPWSSRRGFSSVVGFGILWFACLATALSSLASRANAQIGTGQCVWHSNGSIWILDGCDSSLSPDCHECGYPSGVAVADAGVVQQFPAVPSSGCGSCQYEAFEGGGGWLSLNACTGGGTCADPSVAVALFGGVGEFQTACQCPYTACTGSCSYTALAVGNGQFVWQLSNNGCTGSSPCSCPSSPAGVDCPTSQSATTTSDCNSSNGSCTQQVQQPPPPACGGPCVWTWTITGGCTGSATWTASGGSCSGSATYQWDADFTFWRLIDSTCESGCTSTPPAYNAQSNGVTAIVPCTGSGSGSLSWVLSDNGCSSGCTPANPNNSPSYNGQTTTTGCSGASGTGAWVKTSGVCSSGCDCVAPTLNGTSSGQTQNTDCTETQSTCQCSKSFTDSINNARTRFQSVLPVLGFVSGGDWISPTINIPHGYDSGTWSLTMSLNPATWSGLSTSGTVVRIFFRSLALVWFLWGMAHRVIECFRRF